MNSDRNAAARTLALTISTHKAEQFLLELANLRDEDAAPRFRRRYGHLFDPELPHAVIRYWAIQGEEEDVVNLSDDQIFSRYWLLPLRDSVRRLWISDERTKRWGMFRILEKY